MKHFRKCMLLLVMLVSFFACSGVGARASTPSENIDVTVFKDLEMICPEDSLYGFEELFILNNSLVPIKITTVHAEEHNGWELVPEDAEFPKDSKKVYWELDGDTVLGGENDIADYMVGAEHRAEYYPTMRHAIWTYSAPSELAFTFTFEYEIGTAEFQLFLDSKGGNEDVEMTVKNGTEVALPTPTKDGYQFIGWKDPDGNVYSDAFVMPIGDTTLTATWKKEVAYALYVASDSSLRFVRTTESLYDGCTYNGMTVTKVYKGFENASYSSVSNVPWYDGSLYNNRIIKQVIVQDKIQPVSTAYWFANMCDCEFLNLSLLDTSKTTNMSRMFMRTGMDVTANVRIYGVDEFDTSNVTNMSSMFEYTGQYASGVSVNLSKWNVSNVTNMNRMFIGMGYYSKVFSLGNLSNWDVSNVTNMDEMFKQAGFRVTWSVDCSGWNVSKVTSANDFKYQAESKVTEPNWVF